MTACTRFTFVLCVLATGCGGSTSGDTDTKRERPVDGGVAAGGASGDGAPDGGRAAGGVGDAQVCNNALPVPQRHRARPETCPRERGSGNPLNTASCADTSGILCKSDADCTAGMNGRCFPNDDPCRTICSYDDCLTDSDCPAGQPCTCRASGTEAIANYCVVGSSCTTDANCGNCGFCSLGVQRTLLQCSVASDAGSAEKCFCEGVTSEAYACHTMNDECTDDSDCPRMGGYCAYVSAQKRWACTACLPSTFH